MEIRLDSLPDARDFIALVRRADYEQLEQLRLVLARARRELHYAIQRADRSAQ